MFVEETYLTVSTGIDAPLSHKASMIIILENMGLLVDLTSYSLGKQTEERDTTIDPLDCHGRAGVGSGSQRSAVCGSSQTIVALTL